MRTFLSAFTILGILISGTAPALDPAKAITQYVHESWKVEQGLSDNAVYGIFQTPDGYLWLRTESALLRFDGIRFTAFDKKNIPELRSSGAITAAYGDPRGGIWVGTSRGELLFFRSGIWRESTVSLGHIPIEVLLEDRKGTLWVGTRGSGLYALMNGEENASQVRGEPEMDSVRCLYEDEKENLWVGTDGQGLRQYRRGKWIQNSAWNKLSNKVVMSVLVDQAGDLWAATLQEGVFRFSGNKWIHYDAEEGFFGSNTVYRILKDRDGNIWFATHGGGLSRFSPIAGWTRFSREEGLGGLVDALFEDREGSLWIGTGDAGLHRFRDENWSLFTEEEGLLDDLAVTVCQDRRGSIWTGTNGGLFFWANGKWSSPVPLPSGVAVHTLLPDSKGNLWIGSDKGLYRLSEGKVAVFPMVRGARNDDVLALYEDPEGGLWVGSRGGGLQRFRDNEWTDFSIVSGLTSRYVRYILQDHNGAIWVATNGGGVNRLENGRWSSYTTKDGLLEDRVLCLYEDRDGHLWIGTHGGGISRFKDGKIENITSEMGLPNDVVYSILPDDQGNLWMNSDNGIFRVKERELEDLADGKRESITSRWIASGVKTIGGVQPAAWKARDGKLWFATSKGVLMIDPQTGNHQSTAFLQALVETVILGGKPAPASGPNGISTQSIRDVEFQYTALSLLEPAKTVFRYQLLGFDKEWIEAGTRRSAFYTNLPPGKYFFQVMARGTDGLWSKRSDPISMTVLPYFYETGWFYAACFLVALTAIGGAYRFRTRHLRAAEETLASVVATRTEALHREIEQRKEVEKQLTQLNEDLEQRVEERTTDLIRENSERRQTETALRKHIAQRSHLLAVAETLLSTLSLEAVLQRIMSELREVVAYDVCAYFTVHRKEGILEPSALIQPELISSHAHFWRIPVGKGIVGAVAASGKGELVNNAHLDPRATYPDDFRPDCEHLIALPVLPTAANPGVLYMGRLSDPPFTADDYESVELFVKHFTLALQNENLYDAVRNARDEFESNVKHRTQELTESLHQLQSEVARREETERTLMKSITTNRALLNTIPDMILRLHRDGTILNYKAPREISEEDDYLRKISEEQLVHRKIQEFLPSETVAAILAQFKSAMEAREIQVAEYGYRFPTSDLTRFYEVRVVEGSEDQVIAIVRDITDRKRQERTKDEFISIVSHELRTPLSSLYGALKLLRGGIAGEMGGKALDLLDISLKSSERLTQLVDDILDLSKLELGQMVFRSQPQCLKPILNQAVETSRRFAEQFGVGLELDSRAEDARVLVDSNRLIQVLVNILSNAIKFSPQGEPVSVTATRENGEVRVSVSDRGPGIPEEFKPRVFEKFSQADSANTRTSSGTGLGLCITKALVERMNGKVGFDSTQGEGATFYIILPEYKNS